MKEVLKERAEQLENQDNALKEIREEKVEEEVEVEVG